MGTFLTKLECTYCGEERDPREANRTCPVCGKVLFARYDLEGAARAFGKADLAGRVASMWRYREVMPVADPANVVTLGEGFTPMLRAQRLGERIGLPGLLVKDEGLNPTGTFKARGLSAAVSKAKELGLGRLTMPSAGNAAGALAAYCAAGGLEAHVFMPRDAPEANRVECAAYGASLTLVDGVITDAGRLSAQAASERGLFDVSTLREPYRVEGKKTMGYEIAEQLSWSLPDAIVYPTGGGTGIVGMWKAFGEMEAMGWVGGRRPRMVCVQAEGCAPLVRAFEEGSEFAAPAREPRTVAAGLRVPAAIGDYLVLRAVRESGGTALTVTDGEMVEAVGEMARLAGVFPAPEGAATLAAARKLVEAGWLGRDERVLLLNTGSGLKYLDVIGAAPVPRASASES
ncbi:MAG: threonine synthase [Gemmatimonadetes bacterium]|nr:threonine synthase [Gemmatimonadota bacterium]